MRGSLFLLGSISFLAGAGNLMAEASVLCAEADGVVSAQVSGSRFEFASRGVSVQSRGSVWSYRFSGSRGGIRSFSIEAAPQVLEDNRLEYRHSDGVVERYRVEHTGVEQEFVLPGPFRGGDVLLTGDVETDLVPDRVTSFQGFNFVNGDAPALYYGAAAAVDAAGRKQLLEERWRDGELTIVVPASFLSVAQFPVIVDPWLGVANAISFSTNVSMDPMIASTFNTDLRAILVYASDVTGTASIRANIVNARGADVGIGDIVAIDHQYPGPPTVYEKPRAAHSRMDNNYVVVAAGDQAGILDYPSFMQINRVSQTGTVTEAGFVQAYVGTLERDPDVACNFSGTCLVVWSAAATGTTTDEIWGALYAPGTNTLGSPFRISAAEGGGVVREHPRVATNLTDFYVVFREFGAGLSDTIRGFPVTAAGTVGAGVNPVQASSTIRRNPAIANNIDLGEYLVVWDDGTNIRGSLLSNASPPVPLGGSIQLSANSVRPEVVFQQSRGWSLVGSAGSGALGRISLIRPTGAVIPEGFIGGGFGIVANSWSVAYFINGLSVFAGEETLNFHLAFTQEFRTPSTEYADFDNNGFASAFVWRPGASATFYYANDLTSAGSTAVPFGTTGDIPVRGDFDGDGTADIAVFRPSTGTWYFQMSSAGARSLVFGTSGDIPVPGDYSGQGRTQPAVFRPSTGTWYVASSASSSFITRTAQFGASGDIPVPADYDGDFMADFAVWRPSTGFWFVKKTSNGGVISAQFGQGGDIPVPGDFGPNTAGTSADGRADFAIFRPSNGTWYVSRNRDGVADLTVAFGQNGDIPLGGIYDNNPAAQSCFGVFRPSNGTWYIDANNTGTVTFSRQFGQAGEVPMQQYSGQYNN